MKPNATDALAGTTEYGSQLVHAGRHLKQSGSSVNPPVYRASTFLFKTFSDFQEASLNPFLGNFYGRLGTPTSFAFEAAIAELEGSGKSIATSSGLSAIVATFLAFLGNGDHVLVPDSVYDPVRRFCNRTLSRFGIEVQYYDPLVGEAMQALIRPNTALIYMESPGSGTFEMQDVPAIVALAKAHGIRTAIDNTWATPLYFKPLALGVDAVIHAATKYIVGHSDAMLGVVTVGDAAFPLVRAAVQDMGACAGSEEVNLGLRGLRTMEIRLRQHQASALAVAGWLREQPEVRRVFYPALKDSPGHGLWKRDFHGACGLLSLELNPVNPQALEAMIDSLRYFKLGFSWGGFESLILPAHPEKSRTATTWDGKGPVLRLHVGLENVEDLLRDLAEGLSLLNKV